MDKKYKKIGASVALTVGVGVAIGGSMGSYLMGMIICFPLGVALYLRQVDKKTNENRPKPN